VDSLVLWRSHVQTTGTCQPHMDSL